MSANGQAGEPLVNTGIGGLDDVLCGGLTPDRLYLVEGDPGAGKTTLGLQLLLAGKVRGERSMYVSLSETREELQAVARSHGWSLDGVSITELAPSEASLSPEAGNLASTLEEQAAQGQLDGARTLVERLETMTQELLKHVDGLSLESLQCRVGTTGDPGGLRY